jgi:NAD-specific glutamate dehydrogenase
MAEGKNKCHNNKNISSEVKKMIDEKMALGKSMTDIFKIVCFEQKLDIAKCIYANYSAYFDIHCDYDEIFVDACLNNHIEIAKWLMSLDPNGFNIHIDDNAIIEILCKNGIHLEMIQWLLTINNPYSKRIDFSKIEIKGFGLGDMYTPNINTIHTGWDGGIPLPSV